jgi:hypothetical protein
MRPYPCLTVIILAGFLGLALPLGAQAEVVGKLTMVEGGVGLLKGGKPPARPVKVGDGVEPGDVLRTKSLSRAQITFLDNTTLTLSPESRIAIEDYMFDPAKGKRQAVLRMFQGLALFVVPKIFTVETPDFIVKTHTAVMGVRGTEVGIRLTPLSSVFLNFKGRTRISSIFAEVPGSVELATMQGTTVQRGLPPTVAYGISPEDRRLFMNQLASGALSSKPKSGVTVTTSMAAGPGTAGPTSSGTGSLPASDAGTGTLPAEVQPGATAGNTGPGIQGQVITSGVIANPVVPPVVPNPAPPVSDFQAHHPHLKK